MEQAPPSAADTTGPRRWRFGTVEFDESTLALVVNGKAVELEPKPLELLMYLLRRAGEVASKDQLLTALWPGRVVTEASLTKAVAKLRQALADDEQVLLRTVHGFGYRFAAPVTAESIAAPAPLPPPTRHALERRLVAIMFTDIVGYTDLVQRNEALARELLEFQRKTVRAILPRFSGREVEVIGDAFLVEFPSALRAAECALAIQQQLAARAAAQPEERRLALRIGLHVGDIERLDKGVFGDSVNIASRIQALAPPGGIATSAQLHDQVHNKLTVAFQPLGAIPLKGVARAVEVLVLDAAAVVAAPTPAGITPLRPRWGRPITWAAGIAVLAVLGGAAYLATSAGGSANQARDKSIAVLPFSNFSSEPQNQHLADGVQETILTLLAGVSDLKVISRTSVMRYREGAHNLPEIGRALGVAHVLEGSVQRTGDRVRITAQLIAVDGDQHLWAKTYDRTIEDIFAIQSEVAGDIADSIRVALTPAERERLTQSPTGNPQAYELYLRTLAYGDSEGDTAPAEALLNQAIALDPQFALAHARLAIVHLGAYWWGRDVSEKRLGMARAAAERAQGISPELAEVHLAWGLYYYRGLRDYPRAIAEVERALALQPNSAELLHFSAAAKRRLGRWDDAVADLRRARSLDPHNPSVVLTLAESLEFLRRYAEADRLYERWIATATPGDPMPLFRAYERKLWKGDLQFLRKALAESTPNGDETFYARRERVWLAQAEGRYADGIRALEACNCDWIPLPGNNRYPKQLDLAPLYALSGNQQASREHYRQARDLLAEEVRRKPQVARSHEFLALAHAGLGDRDAALAAIQQATTLFPPARDALEGPDILATRARILMMLGDLDQAMEEIEGVLAIPSHYSIHLFALNPIWKPIHAHPRFKKLLAERLATG